jgi:alkylhydroperoxidase family enzyme
MAEQQVGAFPLDTDARQALVLGDGPRIAPLEVETLTDDLRSILALMVRVNTALDSRQKGEVAKLATDDGTGDIAARLRDLPEIVRTMLRHPDLFSRQTEVGMALLSGGALAPRDRELAVLRIGWLCQAPYEWGEHVLIGKKVGISDAEIERITRGAQEPGWSDHDAAIVRAVEELHRDAMISDATWATLSQRLNDKQLIELPILVGQYQTVAYYQNSLRLRLHQDNIGLAAR